MRVGFDYGGVLDSHELITDTAKSMKVAGHTIYIVSAVSTSQGEYYKQYFESQWPSLFDEIITLECATWDEHPTRKLEVCRSRDIAMFFDDREDTNILLRHYGILAFTVHTVGYSTARV
jgi:hypothetical protein